MYLRWIVYWGILSILIALPAAGQETTVDGRLTGRIITADEQEPLENATVEVRLEADSTLVTGSITDENGTFSIEGLPTGDYFVRLGFVGYATRTIKGVRIAAADARQDLGDLELTEDTEYLDDVEVTAERSFMEAHTDRTVYNVADHPVTAGGSASDVLRELPSIEIDIEGAISYRGNANVAIHIDGRPSALTGDALISFLQSLPADGIERVETIPTPSARHEPEGMAGIINIVLAKNRTAGWSGGLTTGLGTAPSFNASPNIGYQSNRWTFFTNYGLRHTTHDFSRIRLREHRGQNPTSVLEQASYEDHAHLSHSLNAELDYHPSSSTTLGLSAILSQRANEIGNRTDITEGPLNADRERFARLTNQDGNPRRLDTRLTFSHVFDNDESHVLDAQLRFQHNTRDREASHLHHELSTDDELGEPFQEDRDELSQHTRRGEFKADYERPLGSADLEAGYQGSLRQIESERHRYVKDTPAPGDEEPHVNVFSHDEQIHAAYGTLSIDSGPIGIKAGLRAETALTSFTQATTGEDYSNNYVSLFPSAFLTYRLSDARQIQLSYSKRIRRPRAWQLNPLDTSTDPSIERVGNPHLGPAYSHSFELSLTQHWDMLTLKASPFFRRTVNQINVYEDIGDDGKTILTLDNFASSNSYGAELVTTLHMSGWLRGNISMNAHRRVTDAGNVHGTLSNEAFAVNTRANLTFTPRPGLSIQWTQMYRAPMNIAGGRVGSYMTSNVAVRQDILRGRGSISIRARDLFDTMESHVWRSMDAFHQETRSSMNARQLMVTFQYTFGTSQERQQDSGDDLPEIGLH